MKNKKRLSVALFGLILSCLLFTATCTIWLVYGWFGATNTTHIKDFNIETEGADIHSLSVKAYKLKNEASFSQNGTPYTSYELDSQISSIYTMNTYDMLVENTTPVLIEITYTLNKLKDAESRNFKLSLNCSKAQNYIVTKDDIILKDGELDTYLCNISYAVGFKLNNITKSGNIIFTPSTYDTNDTFVNMQNHKFTIKNQTLTIAENIKGGSTQKSETFYILMDYSNVHINNLYALLLEKGGAGLEARFLFQDDITFTLQESN
jgi:hypothetical protein